MSNNYLPNIVANCSNRSLFMEFTVVDHILNTSRPVWSFIRRHKNPASLQSLDINIRHRQHPCTKVTDGDLEVSSHVQLTMRHTISVHRPPRPTKWTDRHAFPAWTLWALFDANGMIAYFKLGCHGTTKKCRRAWRSIQQAVWNWKSWGFSPGDVRPCLTYRPPSMKKEHSL